MLLDLESRVAVSAASSVTDSLAELSFSFSGVFGLVANGRIESEMGMSV